MKYLYCYLGKFIEWESDKDRSLETHRYCDLTNLVKNIPIESALNFVQIIHLIDNVKISEVSLLSPIGDFRPGEMFWTSESLFNSYSHTTYNLDFSEYDTILNGLKVYRDMIFKSTGRFDKWQTSNDCVKVLDEYVKEKTRDLKIDLILD